MEQQAEGAHPGKYVYCIIEGDEVRVEGTGVENTGRIYTIPYRDLAAVVSDSPLSEYTIDADSAFAHERILRQIFDEQTIVPMSFGMVFRDQESLLAIMKGSYEVFKDALEKLKGKVELGVKVILPEEVESQGEWAFGGKTKEEFFKRCAQDFLDELKACSVSWEEGRLFTPGMILNASFLVERDEIDRFSRITETTDAKYQVLRTHLTGPWPPYSFCRIKIRAAQT